ncbi:MAG: hypothetical protein U0228_22210 [Myxococcaceae bacterium]
MSGVSGSNSSTKSHGTNTGSKTTKTTKTQQKVKAYGANPKLAKAVKSINIHKYDAKNKKTFCNMAVDAYAKKLGYKGFSGLTANQMVAKMGKPGSGWHKVSAAEAIKAAKAGKLTVAGWTGKVHGHVAAVIGEYSPGKAAIAQAGGYTKNGKTVNNTFEYGSIDRTRANPSYYVHD